VQKDKQRKQRHSLKLGKKRRESSKRNDYIISPRVIIKAIIIRVNGLVDWGQHLCRWKLWQRAVLQALEHPFLHGQVIGSGDWQHVFPPAQQNWEVSILNLQHKFILTLC